MQSLNNYMLANKIFTDDSLFILAPHADDAILGCGCLIASRVLQQKKTYLIYLSSGAPETSHMYGHIMQDYHDHTTYQAVRLAERNRALQEIGLTRTFIQDFLYPARMVFTHFEVLVCRLFYILTSMEASTILVPAFEGGHPDHDVTNVIGAVIGWLLDLDVIEYPLYHITPDGIIFNQFCDSLHTPFRPVYGELLHVIRRKAMSCFTSQLFMLSEAIDIQQEESRYMSAKNYDESPNQGHVLYEGYEWGISNSSLMSTVRKSHNWIEYFFSAYMNCQKECSNSFDYMFKPAVEKHISGPPESRELLQRFPDQILSRYPIGIRLKERCRFLRIGTQVFGRAHPAEIGQRQSR